LKGPWRCRNPCSRWARRRRTSQDCRRPCTTYCTGKLCPSTAAAVLRLADDAELPYRPRSSRGQAPPRHAGWSGTGSPTVLKTVDGGGSVNRRLSHIVGGRHSFPLPASWVAGPPSQFCFRTGGVFGRGILADHFLQRGRWPFRWRPLGSREISRDLGRNSGRAAIRYCAVGGNNALPGCRGDVGAWRRRCSCSKSPELYKRNRPTSSSDLRAPNPN